MVKRKQVEIKDYDNNDTTEWIDSSKPLNKDDIADIASINERLAEPDIPAHKVHARLSKQH